MPQREWVFRSQGTLADVLELRRAYIDLKSNIGSLDYLVGFSKI